ncbi:hypothetical protein GCM10020256_52340 [Streptomyces thermocoprophilus]
MLAAIRDEFGLAADAEITTEANPESVDPAYLATLREGGFNRISFGMQSARQHVLRILDRTHTPRPPRGLRRRSPRRRVRARQPRPDLRHPPERATTTGAPPSTRPSAPAPTTSAPTP